MPPTHLTQSVMVDSELMFHLYSYRELFLVIDLHLMDATTTEHDRNPCGVLPRHEYYCNVVLLHRRYVGQVKIIKCLWCWFAILYYEYYGWVASSNFSNISRGVLLRVFFACFYMFGILQLALGWWHGGRSGVHLWWKKNVMKAFFSVCDNYNTCDTEGIVYSMHVFHAIVHRWGP